MISKRLSIVFVIILLAGCGTPSLSAPVPTPEAINIIYPTSMQPWADKLSDCAADFPEAAAYFFQQAGPNSIIKSNEIDLMLGQPPSEGKDANYFRVAWEQVVVVVNKKNSLDKLPDDLLMQIFSGQMVDWENGSGQPIQVWALPEGDPARRIFEQALALNGRLANDTKLAPDPQAMIKEIAKDQNAVGYLPASYLSEENSLDASGVKIIQLDPTLQLSLRQPVIAITQGEPTGLKRNLLTCLQNLSQ